MPKSGRFDRFKLNLAAAHNISAVQMIPACVVD
jgi:hypothetical protein